MAQRTRNCLGCEGVIILAPRASGPKFCSDKCRPRCSVEECDGPRVKREWCASHYAQWRSTGIAPRPFQRKWSAPQPCVVCGCEERSTELRRFCSWACRQLHLAYDGNVPGSVGCVLCGTVIDLTVRGKGGQRKKASTKLCRPCRQDYGKYQMSAGQLALRDGANCGICSAPVDMTIRRADDAKWCASVDHVLPRALGGTHEPGNLQLAHLYCNQVKSDLRGVVP